MAALNRFGAILLAEDAERQHRGVDPPELADQPLDERAVRGQVVGVELRGAYLPGSGGLHRRDLRTEPVGAAGGKHHRGPRSQPRRQFDADLTAAAEDDHDFARVNGTARMNGAARCVLHGCDYSLR